MMVRDVFHSLGELSIPSIGILAGYIVSKLINSEKKGIMITVKDIIIVNLVKLALVPFVLYFCVTLL